jgi:hypothetical protein
MSNLLPSVPWLIARCVTACVIAACVACAGPAWASDDEEDLFAKRIETLEKLILASGMTGEIPVFRQLKFVGQADSPIAGLKAYVYDAMVDEGGRTRAQRIVFYADAKKEIVVIGALYDMKNRRDLSQDALASVSTKEVSLASLQRLPLLPGKRDRTVTVVIDLGVEAARKFLLDVIQQRGRFDSYVDLALVTTPNDEKSVGASSIIAASRGDDFYRYLSEWLKDGPRAPFMREEALRKNPKVAQLVGQGIWHLERNTSALIAADVRRLPLIFVTEGGKTRAVSSPKNDAEFCLVFGCTRSAAQK